MRKVTLLLLPMPSSMMVSLLSASMLQIYAAYPQYDESIVTMLLTIPNLTVMIGLLLAPAMLRRFPIKVLIIAGLGLFTVSNVLCVWCSSFYLLLALRALSGIGCGLTLPLQATILATYPERERASLMGYTTTVSCLVAAVLVSVSGVIAAANWRYVFFLYLITALALVMAIIFLPTRLQTNGRPAAKAAEGSDDSHKAPARMRDYRRTLCTYYFLLIGCFLFISVLASQIAPYLEYTAFGGPTESGIMMSIYLIGSVVSGLMLGRYLRLLKRYAMAGIFFGSTVSFALLAFAPVLPVVAVAAFLIGYFSAIASGIMNYELSRVLPLSIYTTAVAGVNFFIFVLQFISPILFLTVLSMVPAESYRVVFMLYAIIHAVFILLAGILLGRKTEK